MDESFWERDTEKDELLFVDDEGLYFGSEKNAPSPFKEKFEKIIAERERFMDELEKLIQEDKKKKGKK